MTVLPRATSARHGEDEGWRLARSSAGTPVGGCDHQQLQAPPVKQAALAWVPQAMRFAAPVDEAASDCSDGESQSSEEHEGEPGDEPACEEAVAEIEEAA